MDPIRRNNIREAKAAYSDSRIARSFAIRSKALHVKRLVAQLAPKGAVLEVGFGAGTLLHELVQAYPTVNFTATELVEAPLTLYRHLHPEDRNVRLLKADAEKRFPFASSSFDIILASHVLEHIKNEAGFLEECLRVLKSGGFLIIGVPRMEDRGPRVHYRHYTKKELTTLSATHKMKLVKVYPEYGFVMKPFYNRQLLKRASGFVFSKYGRKQTRRDKLYSTLYHSVIVNGLMALFVLDMLLARFDDNPLHWIAVYTKDE